MIVVISEYKSNPCRWVVKPQKGIKKMKKMFELIGEFVDGSTEYFGKFKTEDEAIYKAEHLSTIFGDELGQFWIKIVICRA